MVVLEGCTIELSDDSDGFTFMINFPGHHSRTYIMCADTQEDMESWMKVREMFKNLEHRVHTRLIKSDEMGLFFLHILIYFTKYPYSSKILFSLLLSHQMFEPA